MSKIRIAIAGLGVSALLFGGAVEPAMAGHKSKTKIKVHKKVKSKGGNGGNASGANGGAGGAGGSGGAVVCQGNSATSTSNFNGLINIPIVPVNASGVTCGASTAGNGGTGGNGGVVAGGAGGSTTVTNSNNDTWTTVGNTAQAG